MKLNSIQEIIEDISQGKMVILMDDEDRENEGDLVLAAELVDAEAINFMATHARGLICLAINEDRCKTLGLEQMVKNNGTELGTAFTTSIEAAEGVTTGNLQQIVLPLSKQLSIYRPGLRILFNLVMFFL